MIHIVMSTYNGEKYIQKQIQSIIDNTNHDWKLYVIDDCSCDSTISIITSMKTKCHNQIEILCNTENKGVTYNFLYMVNRIKKNIGDKDYVMFCVQDDVWNSNKIEVTLNKMKELEKDNLLGVPLLVCSDVKVVDSELNVISESFARMNHYDTKKIGLSYLLMENKVQGCTAMINRRLCEKISSIPNEVIMYDGWIGIIAAALGKIVYITEPTMLYRQHGRNVMGSNSFKEDMFYKIRHIREQRKYIYGNRKQIECFYRLYGDELEDNIRELLFSYIALEESSWIKKRIILFKYHMWKSSLIRNIGMILMA